MKKALLIIAVFFVAVFVWYKFSLTAVKWGSEVRHSIDIESGKTTKEIAAFLEEKDLIRSKLAFLIHMKLTGSDGTLQAGKFVLRESLSTPEVVIVLQTGKADEMIITIPEGFTLKDIEAELVQRGLLEEDDLVKCARKCDFESFEFLPDSSDLAKRGGKVEGYLYPDTYFVVADDFVPKFFLERLMTTFRKKVLETYTADFERSEYELHEIITMASLIEEEAVTDEERFVISGILWKRYDDGRGLGVDATVRYITGNATGPITAADLNVNSDYNTRKFRGLPPGPIASPSRESIRAALNPEDSSYWYYLHDASGTIHYAETNDAHNINRMQYLN